MPTAGRQQVAWDDVGKRGIPMKVDGTVLYFDKTAANGIGKAASTGNWVKRSAAETVTLTTDASDVFGQVGKIDADNIATIYRWGVLNGPSQGTITYGTGVVGAVDGSSRPGFIRTAVAATVAETSISRGRVIDVADATNVYVDFGAMG